MLNRIAVYEVREDSVPGIGLADGGRRALVRWACEQRLGQDSSLVADVERREAALEALRGDGVGRAWRHARLRAVPEWRLVVGLGNRANAHEIGLSLHGTYGWPVIPGSSLKGLAAAWARSAPDVKPDDMKRVFGTPAGAGSVRFLDAIPAGSPVTVEADVLTPHVKPYYDSVATGAAVVPPAEYHNPVPVTFLTVRGAYAVDLYGMSQDDLDLAAEWLKQAGDELGAGAKTAAGYGYLAVKPAGKS
jgi:CRISPR-associated protein Cmr6